VSLPPPARPPSGRLEYRFPAEWRPHEATWVGWPHNTSDWPGKFGPIPWVYGEIIRNLTRGETARILVNTAAHAQRARSLLARAGADLSRVEFFRISTDRGWTRDFGPIFLRRRAPQRRGKSAGAEMVIAGFRFTGWAKYRNHRLDAQVAAELARRMRLPFVPIEVRQRPFVLEGGAIDVNGKGTLITTEECLLDSQIQTRNPGLGRHEIEGVFTEYLGAHKILWLGRGIAGDDTHGHVDDLCRFVNPRTLVLCRERNRKDANYAPLEENWERAQDFRLEDGSKPEIAPLPMPSPLYFDRRRLPASYANFYVCNAAVLVPTFNDRNDRVALGAIAELIPDRTVIGIHAVDLVWGLGTLHCLTQQQPAVSDPADNL
jgi:agmatine deiminase